MNSESDTDVLLERIAEGDSLAVESLFQRQRSRLRRMVQLHIDQKITTRVDPSDIVQETFAEAHRTLASYLQNRPVDFYPWLRRIAWNRLLDARRRHVVAQRRSVDREAGQGYLITDESAAAMSEQLACGQSSPSQQVLRKELTDQVRQALAKLSDHDREILTLIYIERLSFHEASQVLDVTPNTCSQRAIRAMRRLKTELGGSFQ